MTKPAKTTLYGAVTQPKALGVGGGLEWGGGGGGAVRKIIECEALKTDN